LIEILKRDRKDLIVKPEKTTIDENLEGSGNSKSDIPSTFQISK
jgi:hypothetical protein